MQGPSDLVETNFSLPAMPKISAQTILPLNSIANSLKVYRTGLRKSYEEYVLGEIASLETKITLQRGSYYGVPGWESLKHRILGRLDSQSEEEWLKLGIIPSRYLQDHSLGPGDYKVIWPEIALTELPKIYQNALGEIYPPEKQTEPVTKAYKYAIKIRPAFEEVEMQVSNLIAHLLPTNTSFKSWEVTRDEVIPIITRSTGFLGLGYRERVVEAPKTLHERGSEVSQVPVIMPYPLEPNQIDFYLRKVLEATAKLTNALDGATKETIIYAKNMPEQPDLEMEITLANQSLRSLIEHKDEPRAVLDALYFGNRINEIKKADAHESLPPELYGFPKRPQENIWSDVLAQKYYCSLHIVDAGCMIFKRIPAGKTQISI